MGQRMPNWLKKRAELTPDRPAVLYEGRWFSFKELFNRASLASGQLAAAGLSKGTPTAVLLSNHVETVILLFAMQMMGVRTVILNNRLSSEELVWQIKDSESVFLVTESAFGSRIDEISPVVSNNTQIVVKEKLFMMEPSSAVLLEEYDLDDVSTIMYTSGTTGNPKGVMQTYGNHWWSAVGSALNIGMMESDRWLCAVPLFHISGYSILMRSQIYGIGISLHRSFDEEKVIEDIEQNHISIMSVVSTMLSRILEKLEHKRLPSGFRCMLLGGGPAPLPLLEKSLEKHIPVFQTYGMTETSSQFATLSPEYSIDKLGSAGKVLFPNQIKIAGPEGTALPPNAEGEIVVKGPNVTAGYWNREDETSLKIRDGWLTTGDIGYMDVEGFLYVLDRRSDLIISGGENIYPAEVEGVLLSHPGIVDAGVIGIGDIEWGQVPVAFLVKQAGSEVDAQELLSFCQQKLAKYKMPKKYYFIDELPRNASKKLLRRKLRDWLEQGNNPF
ncbi:o-succinylbenzoate--CoA ligase [Bacillus sp. T33-2]|uniref:o-succinylbenzoate--CoA ligase n=1 Tax=Bacillus sp. T33-2 TaxID=2054168 RepID=UPI000C770E46|nr:o-succinylbenzoate--CoA ligase [Bacillus sp. T33-2]PLR98253.1 o-succinylbenzoate--CoA ligase [Bacillus sp. T33-2]